MTPLRLPRSRGVGWKPEKAVQAEIVKLLRSIGASVYVLGTKRRKGDHQGTMQTPGIPDLYAFLPNVYHPQWPAIEFGATTLWIEVKAERGQLSPEQRVFQANCLTVNHAHIVGGLDDVVTFLTNGGWLKAAS